MSFRFKQFSVDDSRCAMKVGTDGVLLGAWLSITTRKKKIAVLDIGTGSGLVALMLAQRFPSATITAIDIDNEAILQASSNFASSPWTDRLNAINVPLQDFLPDEHFDLIVSNPPYFVNSLKNPDAARSTARHTGSLSYEDLIRHSNRLLDPYGSLALVLPAEAEEPIISLAKSYDFYPIQLTRVSTRRGKEPKRILVTFSKEQMYYCEQGALAPECYTTSLCLSHSADGRRSEEYKELTKDFYL